MDVVPDFGVNAYSNLSAAVNGEKQGESVSTTHGKGEGV
jgi:hypothetical protein